MIRTEELLLTNLKSGDSIFKFIPQDIGEILYCDSNNPKAERDSKDKTTKKAILSILIPIVIVAFCWIVFNESPIFDSIVTLLMVVISVYSVKKSLTFQGKDYFVGSEGAAEISFSGTRDNIVKKNVMYFQDFEDIVVRETRQYRNRTYEGTEYLFVIYGHEINNQKKEIARVFSKYYQEKPKDYYTDQKYRFWKTIESYWSKYKLVQIKEALNQGEAIGFNVYTNDKFYNNYILFKGKELTIHGKVYDSSNVKNFYFKNGDLVIEDVNHSTKLFGLIEKGDIDTIPLSIIGNRELFLTFFQYFASTL